MIGTWTFWAVIILVQQKPTGSDAVAPTKWAEFYQRAARQYDVTQAEGAQGPELKERPIFKWSSLDDFHGAVFAWTEKGRPAVVASIFSFPVQDTKQRQAVHEFASFASTKVVVKAPDGTPWAPSALQGVRPVPDAPAAASNASALKLQCRQLAEKFSAHMNRRGERWDLRLLPAPLLEYQEPSKDIIGGALFAFVGYSTDPEILVLLEARRTSEGAVWYFHPVRFSDKSLYLQFKNEPVWESLRRGHGSDASTEDPLYHVLSSERLSLETVGKLSPTSENE